MQHALTHPADELVVDRALTKRELDASRLWVHGYANDDPCYIPSERILQEAVKLFYERGFTGTTLDGLPADARCHAVGGGVVWAAPERA